MRFKYVIEIEVDRVSGKFASRDEIGERLASAFEEAESSVDVSGLGSDGDSEYEVTSFEVNEESVK